MKTSVSLHKGVVGPVGPTWYSACGLCSFTLVSQDYLIFNKMEFKYVFGFTKKLSAWWARRIELDDVTAADARSERGTRMRASGDLHCSFFQQSLRSASLHGSWAMYNDSYIIFYKKKGAKAGAFGRKS